MSEMLSRVTQAIKAEIGRQLSAQPLHGDAASGDWTAKLTDWSPDGGSLDLEAISRVAIEAMREPTEEMYTYESFKSADDLYRWRAMIDGALKE